QVMVKMRSFSLIFILLLILVAETDGQMCRYRFGLCHDVGDIRGRCIDSGGRCVRISGRTACRCHLGFNRQTCPDEIP
ncbi:hypothetical protein ACJMK2_004475, partial [Sinanodonta woodiana]